MAVDEFAAELVHEAHFSTMLEKFRKEGQPVMVLDTSFLLELSNFHAWSWDALLSKMFAILHESGHKVFDYVLMPRIVRQYEQFLASGTVDEYGLKRAARPINDMLFPDMITEPPIVRRADLDVTRQEWRETKERQALRIRQNVYTIDDIFGTSDAATPGSADLSLIAAAEQMAATGKLVCIASADFSDVISVVEERQPYYESKGWKIRTLAPSPLTYELFQEPSEFMIRMTLTGEAIKGMLDGRRTAASYPVVIIENGVTSGSATFEAGVAVAEKRYLGGINYPFRIMKVGARLFSTIPVFLTKEINDKTLRQMGNFMSDTNSRRIILALEQEPWNTKLIAFYGNPGKLQEHQVFRTDIRFLARYSNSRYASNIAR